MRELIFEHALRNAAQYGRADVKAVLSKVMGERPEFRKEAREVKGKVEEVVREVNSLSKEEITKRAQALAVERMVKEKKGLGDLPGAIVGDVKLRFAPNPSGPLHLGHARAAVLNDEYARRYEGELILRFEDTDPKRVDVEAYDLIRKDLSWLEIRPDKEILQSDRLSVYHDYARALFEKNAVYVCTCAPAEFKKLREGGAPCPCRMRKDSPEHFEMMFNEYGEGEAVLRLKTDLSHRNTSFRDFPLMRIVDTPHPRVEEMRVYPLMNFSVAVDDHDLNLTHVLRGKDHILNTHKQGFIFDYFGWEKPVYIHYGLLKVEMDNLSTSEIKKGIEGGIYTGWDDIGLGTLSALSRRGIKSEAVRRAMLDVGVTQTDISFSWKNLYSFNRELVDPVADRYSFVDSPGILRVMDCPETTSRNRLHPTFERGFRDTTLASGDQEFLLKRDDFGSLRKGMVVRLMGAYNVEVIVSDDVKKARFHSSDLEAARKTGARLLNWVVREDSVGVDVLFPERTVSGFGEGGLRRVEPGEIVQFERFGFVRIEDVGKKIKAVFSHK
jgi:glutamyl-tRNA synthetase